ncbi:cyclodeaminase/cyclohydrolase family protein [Zhaonella formicivorans]|uniref:cyclodeaminase/cyclohydrolase family protein n=1 Tax=Zhaonella formicivorans TaxID=2528593 RepID=UPI001D115061|nr:cyclodeaminase/cyclohydrolase family protein [Zhaonella formicivorans]
MFSKLTIEEFLQQASSTTFPSPKGGSLAALAAACAAALVQMCARVAAKKQQGTTNAQGLTEIERQAEQLKQELNSLISEDALAYLEVIRAYNLPNKTCEEHKNRAKIISQKFLMATLTLIIIGKNSQKLLKVIEKMQPQCPASCVGDLHVARTFAKAALDSALWGIEANQPKIAIPQDKQELQVQLAALGVDYFTYFDNRFF